MKTSAEKALNAKRKCRCYFCT